MNKFLIGLAAAGALAVTATVASADGYNYGSVKDAAPVAAQVNWSGVYIGAAVGYSTASTDRDVFGYSDGEGVTNDGFQGVISVGYDRMIHSNVVLGVFADYAFGDLERTESIFGGFAQVKSDISNNWAIGARLGYVRSSSTMWYLNAGYAQADYDWSINGYDESKTLDGYFVGGGVEQQLRDNLFLKAEYRYTDFGKEDIFGDFVQNDTDVHSLRLGVTWKVDLFGGHRGGHDSLK